MKRLAIAIASLILLILAFPCASAEASKEFSPQPGETIFFGQYEQDNKAENGKEPIEWLILDVSEGKALLISRFAIDCINFHQNWDQIVWLSSDIREWLNGEFLNGSFTDEEKTAILETEVSNQSDEGNPQWNPAMGSSTADRVFLLSYQEVMRYFPSQNERKLIGTEYARSRGARFAGVTSIGIGETDWWLRSPGRVSGDAAFITVFGDIESKSVNTRQGIRPALWIDISADSSKFSFAKYTLASLLAEQENYGEATEIFESLGDYNNCSALTKQYRYLYGMQASEIGDYDTAIAQFEALNGYEDSYEQCRATRYAKAVSFQDAGDYVTAGKLFGEVGQYKDSMARMKICFEKNGILYNFFNEKTIKTDMDKGFQGSKEIDQGDKHYGWRMGQFFISNYTRKILKNDSINHTGNIVFLKTLGDSVTLWFDLEQDINALDGNKNLIVAEDTNGYDKYFDVKKTNLGRGALIIRHKDFRDNVGDPVIYTDYLLAKGTTGADTKVILNEEGDYEVALDYELQDNDITHITTKFDNYRIFFTFSIRNGNCMVYPFDVATRAELQNKATTENGFYLDLARSRYLDIDVKRSVIINGPNGVIEDERFNRPAKDGDEYTLEGIYTISVKNRYTGESTTKTIFVGSNELLQQYIANGFNVDRLK